MPRVTAAVDVAVLPAAAFAILADPEQRRRLLPDNFAGFRVLSETRAGPGSAANARSRSLSASSRARTWSAGGSMTKGGTGGSAGCNRSRRVEWRRWPEN